MFDTVNFKLTRAEVEGVDFLREITPYLDPDAVGYHNYNGVLSATGKIGNLSVGLNSWQVRVKDGSLCKWMLGDNYQTMTRDDVQRAIERLSDALHLPMDRALITRLDVGMSIPVEQPCANYFNHLGALAYAKRFANVGSVNYYRHRHAEWLCFYDKNFEQRDKRKTIPEQYRGLNVLRYEQRYMSRLPSLLGVPTVTGAMLYDEEFYTCLLTRWRDAYQAIKKENDITINFEQMRTKRKFYAMGVLAMVERVGGEHAMLTKISEAQKRGELTAKQAFDLRKEVKAVCGKKAGMAAPSEAITELDRKIGEATQLYGCF